MDKTKKYVVDSLELHLFFARIMKEHAFFLKVGFLPPNMGFARTGEQIMRQFENLLSRTISLSDDVVRCCVLESGEIVTDFTEQAERQTQRLTGTFINRTLTVREKKLEGWNCRDDLRVSPALVRQVKQLNRDALAAIDRIINYKERIIDKVSCCEMFTANYPLLIEHILREAKLYRSNLRRLEGIDDCDRKELWDNEYFWDRIMMEHAMFIRGLLDPTENELIDTADDFAKDYRKLLDECDKANDRIADSGKSLSLTKKFRDFKCAGVQGIEDCKIRSIILPLLADHVLREANHYIRLLDD